MQQQKTSIDADCISSVVEMLEEASVERARERRAELLARVIGIGFPQIGISQQEFGRVPLLKF